MRKADIFVAQIQNKLNLIGDVTRAVGQEKYLKGLVKFRGVTSPKINEMFKEEMVREDFMSLSHADRMCAVTTLLQSEYGDDKYMSSRLLVKIHKDLTFPDIDSIKNVILQGKVQDWSSCDSLSKPIRLWTSLSEQNTRYVSQWSLEEECLWLRRCCCVSQVPRARKGDAQNFIGYTDLLFEISERVVKYDQRFNQLGVGWLLRELYLAEPKRTIAFIELNYNYFIREGLRYAIEKMNAKQKKHLISFRKEDQDTSAGVGHKMQKN